MIPESNPPTNQLLFVGLNTIDLQFEVSAFPQENTKCKALQKEIAVGGPASNAAVTAACLGAKSSIYTPVGRHELTSTIQSDFSKYGVHLIDPIPDCNSEPVFASIITTPENGNRTIFSYFPENICPAEFPSSFDIHLYKTILFDGFHLEMALPLARMAKQAGITTILDGGSWKPGLEGLLPYIDIAICSNEFDIQKERKFEVILNYMHSMGIHNVAITRGYESILYSENNQFSELPVLPINVKDTTGAGDIFHGAFCYYYAKDGNFAQSLKWASEVAGGSCRYFGTRSWMSHTNRNLVK
jgi:sugar/nucleoside kinase (ribokinase family)